MKKKLMQLRNRRKEIFTRKSEIRERKGKIRDLLDAAEETELEALEEEIKELAEELEGLELEEVEIEEEIEELEGKIEKIEDDSETNIQANKKRSSRTAKAEDRFDGSIESRARTLRQNRAVTIASGKLVSPKGHQNTINEMLGSGASIVNNVKAEFKYGMGSYEVPYMVEESVASKTTEGAEVGSSDPVFAYATIKPVTIATYSEISREVTKLSDVDYYNAIKNSALSSLKQKVSELIINGDDSGDFVGINTAAALTSSANLDISTIDENTLQDIVMHYGGDEDIVGGAVLYLTKEDLITFGKVRGEKEKRAIYEITPDTENTNAGIIKTGGLSVRYSINKHLTSLSKASTGDYSMFYGSPLCYELAIFGDYTVEVSNDFKFRNRMIAILGEVMVGGNVVVKDGFVRVSKAVTP